MSRSISEDTTPIRFTRQVPWSRGRSGWTPWRSCRVKPGVVTMGGTNRLGLSLPKYRHPEAYAEYEQALACETVVPMLGRWGIAIGGAAILDAGCGMGEA